MKINKIMIQKARIVITVLLSSLPILLSTQAALAASTPTPVLNSPVSNTTYDDIPISYVLPANPESGSEKLIFIGATTYTLTLTDNPSSGTYAFTLNPEAVTTNSHVFAEIPGSPITDGTYSVTFSYQDASADPPASVTATNVVINTASAGITLASLSPSNSATSVSIQPKLALIFNQPMLIGSGNVVIHKVSDGSVVETIPITSSNVTGGGTNTISVAVPTALTNSTAYYITLDSGALTNQTGASFGGISTASTWQFSTAAATISTTTSSDPDTGYGTPAHTNPLELIFIAGSLVSIGSGLIVLYRQKMSGN